MDRMSTMGLFSLIEDFPRKNEEEACNINFVNSSISLTFANLWCVKTYICVTQKCKTIGDNKWLECPSF